MARGSCIGSSTLNFSLLYSLFVEPLFNPLISSVLVNPLFIIPSLAINYILFARYYPFFYFGRSHVINMYLKPNGKQIIVETRDGESKVVNNMDIFDVKTIETKF